MSEYIEVGQPLQFTDPNTPTRVGEIVENVSDIYNIPSPRLGMQVFVKSEKKSFVITSLKSKTIGGVNVPEAAVEAFEPVGAKSITWNNDNNPSNMNDFVVAGVYDIKGERTRIDDNLPVLNTGGGHSFNARLTVLDSSISGSGNSDDKCITQVLSFSNRLGQGEVYIRTGKGSSLNSLTWEKWSTLQRNVNVDAVTSLDHLVDNGIYSGVLIPTGETFVLVVINNYAFASQHGTQKCISQFKYSVNPFGVVSFGKRVKIGNTNFPAEWDILNKNEIDRMLNNAVEQVIATIVDDAPETFDTLKEIADWIANDETGAVALANAISANAKAINTEVTRAEQVEQAIKEKAVDADSLNFQPRANAVALDYKTIEGVGDEAAIPAATTSTAGVMSAEDKRVLDEKLPRLGKILAKNNTLFVCTFSGGTLLNEVSGNKGFYKIGDSLNATPEYTSPASIVSYTATTYSTYVVFKPESGFTDPYRWFAIYDADNNLITELACNTPAASYCTGLQPGWTLLASCEVYLNPEILDINTVIQNLNEEIFENFENSSYSIANLPSIPFIKGSYLLYSNGKEVASAMSGCTPYISTYNIKSIFTTAVIDGSCAKIAFYDRNKNYLPSLSISGDSSEQTYEFSSELKETAKYFRVSFYAGTQSYFDARSTLKISFEKNNNPVIENIESQVWLNTLNTQGITFTDTFDLSTSSLGKYKLHDLPIAAGTPVVFEFIKVPTASLNLLISYKGGPISQLVATGIKTGSTFYFIPEKDIDYFGYYIFKDGNTNAEIITHVLTSQAFEVQTLANKKTLNFLIFGDSITQSYANIQYKSESEPYTTTLGNISGTNWPKQLVESKANNINFRLGEVRNYAKSGASFRDRLLEPRQYLGFQIDEAFADLNAPEDGYYHNKPFNPNVIIVSIGTNDGTPASADTYDNAMSKSVMKDVVVNGVTRQQIDIQATLNNLDTKSTIGEAIRHSYMRLRERFPNALFVYATPIQRLAYETPPTQLELFKSLANRYNFIIADCNSESGIVRDCQTFDGSSGDLSDGLHPTENGSKKILKCIMNTVINNVQYLP